MIERLPHRLSLLAANSSRPASRVSSLKPARTISVRPPQQTCAKRAPLLRSARRSYAAPSFGRAQSLQAQISSTQPPTTTADTDPNASAHDTHPPPPPPPHQKRSLRPYIYATLFFILGSSIGRYAAYVVAPPPLPAPGSREDEILSSTIETMASKLPVVQKLNADPNNVSWPAYSTFSEEEKPRRITSGALGGARGLGGYQHIWHNRQTGEFISVVWIGGALAGWPGVAHGGLLATVLDESLGRAAIATFPVKTGVTAKLEVTYRRPTVTNAFYVVRTRPMTEEEVVAQGLGKGTSGKEASKGRSRKMWVLGTVEEAGSGKVCVEARGLFVLPKGAEEMGLRSLEAAEGVGF
jgi:acyl-coenzyme A thioesterase PaaI-like protein